MDIVIDNLILNLVLIIFPIFVYFIYSCYSSLTENKKYNNYIFTISLVSSLYLVFRYSVDKEILLFLNIPIVISYLKRKSILGIILSCIVIINLYVVYNINIYILILKYVVYFFIYTICNRKYDDYKLVTIISIIEAFYLSIYYFYINGNYNFMSILEMFLISIIFYIVPFFVIYLFKITDNITNLYMTSANMEHDMQLKNSLFKIVHEVKNPIAVCKGYLDMFDVKDINKIKKYIPIMSDEINRSLNIMNDFMEFNKIKLSKDILDINMLINEVSEEMQTICYNRIKIYYNDNGDEIYVDGDYCRLKQVFINIIKNSIESINNKGEIKIKSYLKDDKYYIEISDNGSGMDKEILSKIGDMFFTTKVRGSGLGIPLSIEIIKAHDGSIKYSSVKNKGTKVLIKLPIYSC